MLCEWDKDICTSSSETLSKFESQYLIEAVTKCTYSAIEMKKYKTRAAFKTKGVGSSNTESSNENINKRSNFVFQSDIRPYNKQY